MCSEIEVTQFRFSFSRQANNNFFSDLNVNLFRDKIRRIKYL